MSSASCSVSASMVNENRRAFSLSMATLLAVHLSSWVSFSRRAWYHALSASGLTFHARKRMKLGLNSVMHEG